MNEERKSLLYPVVALLLIFFLSTVSFTYFENRGRPPSERITLFQSAYWAIVTLSTVGYGDVTPKSAAGRAISIFLIIVGLSIYVSVISKFGSFLIGRSLKEAKGLKNCEYEGHVVVLGMNDVVEEAIRQLLHGHKDVAVITETQEGIDRALRIGAFPILGDPTHTESLEMANVTKAATVIINLQDDSKTILAALACRRASKSAKIVASIKERQLIELVRESGVENVISPEALTGRMLASAVSEPHVLDFVDDVTSEVEGADLREFPIENTPLVGKKVGEALTSLRQETGTLLVGLVRMDERAKQISNPSDDEVMGEKDRIILLGYEDQFRKVDEYLKG